jgi:hypothetical protein
LFDLLQKLFYSLPFDRLNGLTVYSGTASISAHFFPGPPQYVGPVDAVIERMKLALPLPLGHQV